MAIRVCQDDDADGGLARGVQGDERGQDGALGGLDLAVDDRLLLERARERDAAVRLGAFYWAAWNLNNVMLDVFFKLTDT